MQNAPDVTQLIGNTPLVHLKQVSEKTGCTILGKAEFLNPGGSIKDRTALGIINAAQAVYGKVRIEIRTHRDDGYVEIADDGQGISPEVQKRIFELFCYKQGFPQWNRPGFKHGLLPLRRSTRRPTFR